MENNKPKSNNCDNKNNLHHSENEFYINITSKNMISFIKLSDLKFREIHSLLISNRNSIGSEINKFFEKIIPTTDLYNANLKLISNNIKHGEFTKVRVNKAVNYFIETDQFAEHSTFGFSKKNVHSLGILLCKSIDKLSSFHIKSLEQYNKVTQKIINDSTVDPLRDYEEYKANLPKGKKLLNIMHFWKENSKKYYAPPMFIFIIKMLEKVTKLKLEFEDYDKDLFYYVILILQNKDIIFQNANEFILDYTFSEYFKLAFEKFQHKMNLSEKKFGKFVKKYYLNDIYLFKHPWNFSAEFIYPNKKILTPFYENLINTSTKSYIYQNIMLFNDKTGDMHQENTFSNLVEQYEFYFKLMLVIAKFISSFKNIDNLTLIFQDSFLKEFNTLLKEIFHLIFISEVHFLDLFLTNGSCSKNLKEFNVEFNTLDQISFEKTISLISSMQNLNSLTISLFPSDAIYSSSGLYKLAYALKMNLERMYTQDTLNSPFNPDENESDQIIVNQLLQYFEKNIFLLFYVILNLKNLKELSIFADSPSIISSNENYSMTLIKFLFNIFILFNRKCSIYSKLKLLFPNLALDSRKFPGIIDFFADIDYHHMNINLLHLHLQFQFFQIYNIHKLITIRLLTLTLSNMDLPTFKAFVKNYSSYSFSKHSELQVLTIGLMPIVTNYNKVKETFEIFLGTHIKNLEKMNVYSHIEISQQQYISFLTVVDKNWIKRYLFEFDKKQRKEITVFAQYHKNDIKYFVIDNNNDKIKNFTISKTIEYVIIVKKVKYKTKTLKILNSFLFPCKKTEMRLQLV